MAVHIDITAEKLLSWPTLLALTLAWVAYEYLIPRRDRLPGPPRLPIVGSKPWIGKTPFDVKCKEFRRKYGSTFEVHVGMQRYVVCSGQDTRALVLGAPPDRAAEDRPDLLFYSQELGAHKWFPPSQSSHHPLAQASRMLTNKVARQTDNGGAERASLESMQTLSKDVKEGKEIDLEHVIRMYSRVIAMRVGFGIHLSPKQIEQHKETQELYKCVQNLLTLYDAQSEITVPYPFLKYLMPARTAARKREAADVYKRFLDAGRALSKQHALKIETDQDSLNVTSQYHLAKEGAADSVHRLSDEDCIIQGAGVIAGTADTTPYTMIIMAGCLMYDKNAQQTIQRQIDDAMRAAGQLDSHATLPSADVILNTPYLHACMVESMRLFPFSPMGFGRRMVRDMPISNGKIVRKGTIVIPHIDEISRDTTFCKDEPNVWRPERQLNGGKAPAFAFGLGSRACPGRELAMRNMLVFFGRLLYLFNIDFDEDVGGKTMEEMLGMDNDTLTRRTGVGKAKLTIRREL